MNDLYLQSLQSGRVHPKRVCIDQVNKMDGIPPVRMIYLQKLVHK